MRYEFTSSAAAMAANGNLSEITPWRLIIDTDEQTITVSKRNKFLIGTDQETLAFRFIRRVEINEHLIGANITIQAVGGTHSTFYGQKRLQTNQTNTYGAQQKKQHKKYHIFINYYLNELKNSQIQART